MKLYGSLTSPYVRKVRIVIAEKSIDCELVVEHPGDADTRFSQLNPLVKIPVLETDGGDALYDSPVIVEYLDQLGGKPLIPASGDAHWQAQRWHALADGVMDAVVARMQELRRPEQMRMDEAVEKQEKKVMLALSCLNEAVNNRNYLVGDSYTVADIAIAVALEYIDFRYPHDWRNRYPKLAYWLASISARPSFIETIPPGMEQNQRPRH
jgi:glutathione S-transferase